MTLKETLNNDLNRTQQYGDRITKYTSDRRNGAIWRIIRNNLGQQTVCIKVRPDSTYGMRYIFPITYVQYAYVILPRDNIYAIDFAVR